MISVGKNDLYTLLMSQNYWYGFLRTGQPADCPKAFLDMVASSVASFQLAKANRYNVAPGTITLTNVATKQPIGGYGEPRLIPVNGVNVQTVAVQPQYIRSSPGDLYQRNALNVAQGQAMLSAANISDSYSMSAGGFMEMDFGRALRFRMISSYANAASGTTPTVQYWNGSAWVDSGFVNSAAIGYRETAVDFTAQRVRIFNATGQSTARPVYTLWAEKGTAFAATPITHMVIVPQATALLASQTDNTYVDPTVGDYFSMIADVGTDFYLETTKTGQYIKPVIGEISIPVSQSLWQEVVA